MDSTDPDATGPSPDRTGPAAEGGGEQAGRMVGRYMVIERVGGGGGGEVYAAFDPVLDRKVALKFLHGASEAGQALIREGRLLAKVVHPAVVEVHEVAFHDSSAFMAMELVDGGDLDRFATRQRKALKHGSILRALWGVADGIIAAHRAGVVHGDIKPSNVLRHHSGAFKVSDFGIARLHSPGAETGPEHPVGTPAFMAPEQHAGVFPDELSDQYALCVTAWVALCGSLPFDVYGEARRTGNASSEGTGPVEDLETRKLAGPPAWPGVRGIPRGVGEALRRGLQAEPSNRWPSIEGLLAAIRPSPARAGLRRVTGVAAAAGLAVAGYYGYDAYDHARRVAECASLTSELESTWNPQVADQARGAMLSLDVGYAEQTADRVLPRLDEWAREWEANRVSACSNASVSGDWDADLLERSKWCLDEHKLGFAAAIQQLRQADRATLDRAVALVSALPATDVCVDTDVLARRPAPPDDGLRETTTEAMAQLSQAVALDKTGKYAAGLEAVAQAREALDANPESPKRAWALVVEGKLLAHSGAYAEAEKALTDGYLLAASNQNWTVAALAAEVLIFTVGRQLDRPTEGVLWEAHARVASQLGGDPLGLHETTRTANLAVVKREQGDYEESIALHERALQLTEERFGKGHPLVATSFGNLGAVYVEMGKTAQARELFEKVVEVRGEVLGADHPSTISALGNLAATSAQAGDLDAAKDLLKEVLARRERVLPAGHPDIAESLDNVAAVHNMLGEAEEALPFLERSLALKETVGPDHLPLATTLSHLATAKSATGDPAAAIELLERCLAIRERIKGQDAAIVGETLVNLGTEHFLVGDLERAETMFERAKTIYGTALGEKHPGFAAAVNNLGDVALESGRYDDAVPFYERAYSIWKDSLGPTHPNTATALAHWGTARLRQGEAEEAMPLLEKAIAIFEGNDGNREHEAQARFELAQAIVAAGGDGAKAVEQAEKARAVVVAVGGGQALHTAELDAWLRDNGG